MGLEIFPFSTWQRRVNTMLSLHWCRQSSVYPPSVVISRKEGRRGEEALTESDRSWGRPGPARHLSAHAPRAPDSPFNAAYHTASQVRADFFTNISSFSPYQRPLVILRWNNVVYFIRDSNRNIPSAQIRRGEGKERGLEAGQKTGTHPHHLQDVVVLSCCHIVGRLSFTFQRHIDHVRSRTLCNLSVL